MAPRLVSDLIGRATPEQRARLRRLYLRLTRPARFGTLRRTTPLSPYWGFDRGTPVDRYYIERFLVAHRQDIHGRALEIKDTGYTDRFGQGVTRAEVLDIDSDNPLATIVADLAAADRVPSDQYDCFILTQTLQLIYDVRAAIGHAHRLLRPGGALLVTVPATSRIAHSGGACTDYWRFTVASCQRLFGEVFGSEQVSARSYGNVLADIAFLSGVAYQELSPSELEVNDPEYPLIIAVRAVKRSEGG